MTEEHIKLLREYFDNQGITQRKIAEDLNISFDYVNRLLNGRRVFGGKIAQRFQELYGISFAWLMTGEGNMLKSDIYNNVLSTGETTQPTEKDNVIYALQQQNSEKNAVIEELKRELYCKNAIIHCKNAIIEELKKKLT